MGERARACHPIGVGMLDLLARWLAGEQPPFASSHAAVSVLVLSCLGLAGLVISVQALRRRALGAQQGSLGTAISDDLVRERDAARRERDAALCRARDLES